MVAAFACLLTTEYGFAQRKPKNPKTSKKDTTKKKPLFVIVKPSLIPFRKDTLWGYADTNRRLKVKPQYSEAAPLIEGMGRVRKGTKWGFVNKTGRLTIPPRYDRVNDFKGGLAMVESNKK